MKKEEIRILYKQKRLALSPKEREVRSEEICFKLFSSFDFSDKIVSLYLPIEQLNEINTYKILEKGHSIGARIALPKVDAQTHLLHHFHYENGTQLEISKWGIPEPKSGKKIALKDIDYVIVPLLAFNDQGQRVGYGKGFYDHFLKKCSASCQFIGLSFFEEAIAIDDTFEGDIALHFMVTPSQLIKF